MTCNICFEDGEIINTCICSFQAHEKCIRNYHNLEYGKIIKKEKLCCPQCRIPARSSYMLYFNNDNHVINTIETLENNPKSSYIICLFCGLKELDDSQDRKCSPCSSRNRCNYVFEKIRPYKMLCSSCKPCECWVNSDTIKLKHSNNCNSVSQYQYFHYLIERQSVKLDNVPKECQTNELIKLAITKDVENLSFISDPTKEICLFAVSIHTNAMKYIKSPDFDIYCNYYLKLIKDNEIHIVDVPKQYWTNEIIMILIDRNGRNISLIDDPTKEMCLLAITKNYEILKYIKNQDREMCLIAINKFWQSLQYVEKQDREMCMIAINLSHEAEAFKYVKNQDKDICMFAVNKSWKALQYVIKQDKDICMDAVKQSWEALSYCDIQDREICLIAIDQHEKALMDVKKQDVKMCMIAVNKFWKALKYVKIQNREMCMIAVYGSWEALKYVEIQDKEMCMIAVNKSWQALEYIKIQDREICIIGLEQSREAIKYIKISDAAMYLKYINPPENDKKSIDICHPYCKEHKKSKCIIQ